MDSREQFEKWMTAGSQEPVNGIYGRAYWQVWQASREALAEPPVQAEPVGVWLKSSNPEYKDMAVIGNPADIYAGVYDTKIPLYLHPPAAQVSTCSNCERCQESLNALDVLTKMNKVIQEAECISPVVKEIASSKVAWLRGDIVVGEYKEN